MCISVFVASLSWWIFALKFCNMTMKACLKIRVVPTGDVRFKCCLNKSKSEHWTPPDFETLIYQIQFSDLKAGGWQDITTQDRPLSLLLRLPHLSSCFYVCRSPKAEETCIYMDHHGSSTDQLNIDPTTHVFELGTSNPTKIWIYHVCPEKYDPKSTRWWSPIKCLNQQRYGLSSQPLSDLDKLSCVSRWSSKWEQVIST